MNWIKVEDQYPADELNVLLCDLYGNIYLGYWDSSVNHFYNEYDTDPLIDIAYWQYLPDKPKDIKTDGIKIKAVMREPIITNDLWVTYLARKQASHKTDTPSDL